MKYATCTLYSACFASLLASGQAALVAQYNFNGNADDQSGTGNHGTLMNGATYSSDTPFGSGFSLSLGDGSQHVLVPHSASLNITESLTISAWVKTQGNAWEGVVAKNPSNGSGTNHAGNYELRVETGSNQMNFLYQQGGVGDTAGALTTAPGAIVGANQWTHIAITVSQINPSPGEVNFYQNGLLVDTKAVNAGFGATNTNPLYIGSRADFFTQFNGQIDDLRIYNTALSAAEIGLLATVPEPSTGLITAAALGLLGLGRRRNPRL